MIWLDWLIILIVGYNVASGLFSGFIRSLVNFVALIAAYLLTPMAKGPVAQLVQALFQLPDYLALPLGSSLAWMLVYVVISAIGMAIAKFVNKTPLMVVDRFLGVSFGLLVSAILVLVPLAAVQSIPLLKSVPPVQQTLNASMMVKALKPAIAFVQSSAGPAIVNYWLKSGDQKDMKQSMPAPQKSMSPAKKSSLLQTR